VSFSSSGTSEARRRAWAWLPSRETTRRKSRERGRGDSPFFISIAPCAKISPPQSTTAELTALAWDPAWIFQLGDGFCWIRQRLARGVHVDSVLAMATGQPDPMLTCALRSRASVCPDVVRRSEEVAASFQWRIVWRHRRRAGMPDGKGTIVNQ
jgi:hypothetical protein